MTSRDIMTALLKREIPERMGIYEHYWPETIPSWREQGFPEDADPGTFFDYDLRGVEGSWFNTSLIVGFQEEVIEETDEWKVRKDARLATLKYWKNKSGTPEHIAFDITSPEKWQPYREGLLMLDKRRIDIAAMREGLAKSQASSKFSFYGNLFIFEILRATLGDLCMLESLLLEPEWIRDFCDVYTKHYITHYDYVFSEAGKPDGMFIYEDMGFRNGLFCSPATLADLIIPFYKQLVGFFHDHGLPVILHTCGDVREAVPLIIESGFDCLQPMEAKAGNDVIEFARQYGNAISYMGNIDVTVLNKNNPKTTREEVERKVKAMREMRMPYMFHSDHSVPPDITFETYSRAVEIFRDNWRYE